MPSLQVRCTTMSTSGHEQQIQIAVIGHYQSEQYTSELFKEIIERECPGVNCFLTEVMTNPIVYV